MCCAVQIKLLTLYNDLCIKEKMVSREFTHFKTIVRNIGGENDTVCFHLPADSWINLIDPVNVQIPSLSYTPPSAACTSSVPIPISSADVRTPPPPFHLGFDLPLSCRLSLYTIVLFWAFNLMSHITWDSHPLTQQRTGFVIQPCSVLLMLTFGRLRVLTTSSVKCQLTSICLMIFGTKVFFFFLLFSFQKTFYKLSTDVPEEKHERPYTHCVYP